MVLLLWRADERNSLEVELKELSVLVPVLPAGAEAVKRISDKRAAQMPIEDEIKRRIYDLGNGMCEYCQLAPIADRGHEIKFRGRGGSCIDPFNIIQLCQLHHDRQHNKIKKLPPIPVDVLAGIVKEIRLAQGFKAE